MKTLCCGHKGELLTGGNRAPDLKASINGLDTALRTLGRGVARLDAQYPAASMMVTNHAERDNTMKREYADVLPALLARNLDPNKVPETQTDADALETERRQLISSIEARTLDAGERAKAAQRIQKVEELLARWRNGVMDGQAGREQNR
jgi:hypothetical protein